MYKLLIADDDEIICNGLKLTIPWGSIGVEVIGIAYDGQSALEIVRSKQPDLILLDINMPVLSGLDLAELVLKEFPKIKIIMITAYKDFHYAQKAIRYHVFDYLTKPFHNDEVIDTIRHAIKALEVLENNTPVTDNENNTEEKNKTLYQQVVCYIKEHYEDPDLSIKTCAEDLHISISYVQTILKKGGSTNFSDLLNTTRLEQAYYILRNEDAKVYEIAYRVGFSSSQYFSLRFKKFYHIEPKEVRKRG